MSIARSKGSPERLLSSSELADHGRLLVPPKASGDGRSSQGIDLPLAFESKDVRTELIVNRNGRS